VDRLDLAPGVVVEVLELAPDEVRGVVDEDVAAAEALEQVVTELGYVVWGGEIAADSEVAGRDIRDHHVVPGVREPLRARRPDPARAAGDEGDPAFVVHDATQRLRWTPRYVISPSITSPSVRKRPWCAPLPSGEPVSTRSPGRSATLREAYETSWAT